MRENHAYKEAGRRQKEKAEGRMRKGEFGVGHSSPPTLTGYVTIEFVGLNSADYAYSSWMKSMTGYGRGDCSQDGFKIAVELSSVNRKQTEISVNLPREMEMLEAQIRDLINRYIARGRLSVRVSLHAGVNKSSARMHLNVPLAKAYARELNRLAKLLNLPGPVTLDQVTRAPGVV